MQKEKNAGGEVHRRRGLHESMETCFSTSKTSLITPLLSEATVACCFSILEAIWSSYVKATIPWK